MQNPMNRSIFVLVAILLLGAVFLISPAQIPVIIFKASLVSLAGILGYWIDAADYTTSTRRRHGSFGTSRIFFTLGALAVGSWEGRWRAAGWCGRCG